MVVRTLDRCSFEQFGNPGSNLRRSWRWEGDLVSALGKSVIVEQQARLRGDVERGQRVFPMPRNDQHGFGPDAERSVDASQIGGQAVPHVRRIRGRVDEKARAAAMWDKQCRKFFDGVHREVFRRT